MSLFPNILPKSVVEGFSLEKQLHYASEHGDVSGVSDLLAAGSIDVNWIDPNDWIHGYAALHYAVLKGNQRIIEMLIAAGANVNIQTVHDGRTPTILCASNRSIEAMRCLVNAGADVNIEATNGWPTIHYAVKAQNKEMVGYLLEEAGSYVFLDSFHCAIMNGEKDIVYLMLRHGADIQEKSTSTKASAVQIAKFYQRKDILFLLRTWTHTSHVNRQKKKRFNEILKSNKKSNWNRSRVMFVGQGRVGKSATVRSLLGKVYVPFWDSTIGAEVLNTFTSKSKWTQTHSDGEVASKFAAKLLLESKTSNNILPKRRAMKSSSLISRSLKLGRKSRQKPENVDASVELMESTASVEELDTPSSRGGTHSSSTASSPSNLSSVAGSSTSVVSAVTQKTYRQQMFRDVEKNKDSISLSLWDFGGQEVFYTMHHIFLTKNGVYVLVFDIREMLKPEMHENAVDYVMFWLRSIRLHAPHAGILITGTFANDCSREEIFTTSVLLKELLGDKYPQVIENEKEELVFFPIDNKFGEGIKKLRMEIEKAVHQDEFTTEKVSIKWMLLLDDVLSKSGNLQYISLQDFKSIAANIGINDELEQEMALELFHEQGALVHLTATNVLKKTIIIDPQWLIDNLSKLIRDKGIHAFDKEDIEKRGLTKDVETTFRKAIVTSDLLEYVWKDPHHCAFFLDLMKQTMLLSDWPFSGPERTYLVPSLLQEESTDFSKQENSGAMKCIFDFSDNFLPTGLFTRLVCLIVAHFSSFTPNSGRLPEPSIYKNYVTWEFNDGNDVIEMAEDKLQQHIIMRFSSNSSDSVPSSPIYVRYILVLKAMITKINYDVMGAGIKWITLYEDINRGGRLIRETEAEERKLSPWFDDSVLEGNDHVDPSESPQSTNIDLFLEDL